MTAGVNREIQETRFGISFVVSKRHPDKRHQRESKVPPCKRDHTSTALRRHRLVWHADKVGYRVADP
ncbi:hypothetical protein TNCV_3484081 [Trichonephila clavipes]|nr:hypothetical protein TNCV_3484081 [Trichonephila clavipes]